MTFWDAVAPLYDFFEGFNKAYKKMIIQVCELIPPNATVLELAAGTANISIAISPKSSQILCTDIARHMLKIARRKAKNLPNVQVEKMSIFETALPNNSHDVVIASQVLHLIDAPEKAAAEIKRVAKNTVILPICLLGESTGVGRLAINAYKLIGYKPKHEFTQTSYQSFIEKIGFENCEFYHIKGKIPMAIAVWQGGVSSQIQNLVK